MADLASGYRGHPLVLVEGFRTFEGLKVKVVGSRPPLLPPDAPRLIAPTADRVLRVISDVRGGQG